MKSPKDMKIIMIEITNACIHSCSNCTRFCGHHKKPFFMDFDTFKRAVDSMKGFEGILGIMGGEPTIHPQFDKFVEYYRENWGWDDFSRSYYQPKESFIHEIITNTFNIDINNRRGLWSSICKKYYDHFELIQDTFGYQALNDHQNPSYHQTLLVTRKELNVPDERWSELRDNCWIQNIWSASITPKGAFFCEVAAAMDMLLDGPGGWPIDSGWWKREPQEFGQQLEWCELCSAPLAMPKRDAREGRDDASPVWCNKLKEIDSPKFKKGKVKEFDIKHYDPNKYRVITESIPYMEDQQLRLSDKNETLYFKNLECIIQVTDKPSENELTRLIEACNKDFTLKGIIAENSDFQEFADVNHLSFLKTGVDHNQLQISKIRQIISGDWCQIVFGNGLLDKTDLKKIYNYVYNPGCLYYLEGDKGNADYVNLLLFNFKASSLKTNGDLDKIMDLYPEHKRIKLDPGWPESKEVPADSKSPQKKSFLKKVKKFFRFKSKEASI